MRYIKLAHEFALGAAISEFGDYLSYLDFSQFGARAGLAPYSISPVISLSRNAISAIVGASPGIEMDRAEARRVVALMECVKSTIQFSTRQEAGEPMRLIQSSVKPYRSIAKRLFAPGPFHAWIRLPRKIGIIILAVVKHLFQQIKTVNIVSSHHCSLQWSDCVAPAVLMHCGAFSILSLPNNVEVA